MPRHLPVLPSEPPAPLRPAWQWTCISAGFQLTLWLPTTLLAARFGITAVLLTYALAALATGFLLARFGTGAGLAQVFLGQVLAALAICALAVLRGALPLGMVSLATLLLLLLLGGGLASVSAKFASKAAKQK